MRGGGLRSAAGVVLSGEPVRAAQTVCTAWQDEAARHLFNGHFFISIGDCRRLAQFTRPSLKVE
ncbi:hypothetical protein MES4922_90016 [Mesorhizobium ventifaucium]|uniref:DUF982 domain-containing protein n=1 Tax=Mesorhizobium ventifaucium TaxID=666020 RepID=A0ABN8KEU5_9HYPH|nr:hypothetical protein MES4922_90016 [Mesorhizobium ventifaucium]